MKKRFLSLLILIGLSNSLYAVDYASEYDPYSTEEPTIEKGYKNSKTNIPNDQVFLTEVSDKIKDGLVVEQEESNILDKSMQNTIIILPTAIVIILVISWINMASIRARQEMPDKDMAIGKSKARLIEEDENAVRFDNVAGIEEEKGELKEIVDFLKNPQKYIEMGARIPKGVLLVGRPGTR